MEADPVGTTVKFLGKIGFSEGLMSSIDTAIALIAKIPDLIIRAKEVIMALGFFIVLAVLGYVIYWVLSRTYMRAVWLSSYYDLQPIENELYGDTATALAHYVGGVRLVNYMRAKGPYPSIYGVQEKTLQVLLRDLQRRVNLFEDSSAYRRLKAWIAAQPAGKAATTTPALQRLFQAALQKRDAGLIAILYQEEATFKGQMARLDTECLFNFIDYAAYEQQRPETDGLLRRYGRAATAGRRSVALAGGGAGGAPGMGSREVALPLGRVFRQTPSQIQGQLSTTPAEVQTARRKMGGLIASLAFQLRDVRRVLLERVGSDEAAYQAWKRGRRQGTKADDHPLVQIYEQLYRLDEILTDVLGRVRRGRPVSLVNMPLGAGLPGMPSMGGDPSASVPPGRGMPSMGGNPSPSAPPPLQAGPGLIEAFSFAAPPEDTRDFLERYEREHAHFVEVLMNTRYTKPDGGIVYFTEPEKQKYIALWQQILTLFRYPRYRDTIHDALFLSLYWSLGDPPQLVKNMQGLSNYYLSINDLCLFREYDSQLETPRRWRRVNKDDIWSFYGEYLFKPYFYQYITKGIIIDSVVPIFNVWRAFRISREYWRYGQSILLNPRTYVGNFKEGFADGDAADLKPPERPTTKPTLSTAEERAAAEETYQKEGFLGSILRPIIGPFQSLLQPLTVLGRLASGFLDLLRDITTFITGFIFIIKALIKAITKPIQFVRILVGFILYIVAGGWTIFMSIPLGFASIAEYIGVAIYYVVNVPYATFNAGINAALFLITIAVGFVFALLDGAYFDGMLTRWFYRNFMATENLPTAWYKQANYHKGNVYERITGLCSLPCRDGFEPTLGGLVCKRTPTYIPIYQPAAVIMRIAKGLETSRMPFTLSSAIPYNDWGGMTASQKQKLAEEMVRDKAAFFRGFQGHRYDAYAKNICRMQDVLGVDRDTKERLRDVCEFVYAQNGAGEPFNYRYVDTKTRGESAVKRLEANVFERGLYMLTMGVVFTAVLYYAKRSHVISTIHYSD